MCIFVAHLFSKNTIYGIISQDDFRTVRHIGKTGEFSLFGDGAENSLFPFGYVAQLIMLLFDLL